MISTKLWMRLLAAGGTIESGEIANMRIHRMQTNPKIHVRIVGPGEGRTLCGVPLRNHGEWAWQFINRGHVPDRAPCGILEDRYGSSCKTCQRHPIIRALAEVRDAKQSAFGGRTLRA